MERDTSDVDGGGGGKVNAFDRGAWSKLDNITRRDPVADDVELLLVGAMRRVNFVDFVYMGFIGGEKT